MMPRTRKPTGNVRPTLAVAHGVDARLLDRLRVNEENYPEVRKEREGS